MIALGKHLRRHDEQRGGGCGFRRDCPICRAERLAGALPDDRIIPPTARVTFAIGSLVAGSVVPSSIALADRGGRSDEGVAIQAPPMPAPPARDAPLAHALDAGAAPVVDADRDSAPGDRGRSLDRHAAPSETETQQTPPAPSNDDGPIGKSGPHVGPHASPPPAPAPPPPAAAPERRAPERHAPTSPASMRPRPPVPRAAIPSVGASVTPRTGTQSPAATRTAAASQPTRTTDHPRNATPRASAATSATASPLRESGGTRERMDAGDTYVVQEGDCLWRIAARRLGEGANDAAIAKEVTRLWKSNAKHIGTGDPDLIYPGQKLTL